MAEEEDQGVFDLGIGVADFITQVVEADLGLQERSLGRRPGANGFADFHFARNIAGRMAFTGFFEEDRHFFFGLFGEKRSEKVADIRVKFKLEPGAGPIRGLPADPSIAFVFPPFVKWYPEGGYLEVTLHDGIVLRVKRGDEQKIEFWRLMKDGSQNKDALVGLQAATSLLETLADWEARPEAPNTIRLPLLALKKHETSNSDGAGHLGALLETVAESYRAALAISRLEPDQKKTAGADNEALLELQKKERSLSGLHPVLGGAYRFESLRADILAKVDASGALVRKGKSRNALQFDFRSRLGKPGEADIVLSLRLTELLNDGPVHRVLVDGVVAAKDRFAGTLAEFEVDQGLDLKLGQIKRKTFEGFVESAGHQKRISFLRLQERQEDDRELIWIQGELEGKSLDAAFAVTVELDDFPNIKLRKLKDVELLAFGSTNTGKTALAFKAGKNSAAEMDMVLWHAYYERLFNLLFIWAEASEGSAP